MSEEPIAGEGPAPDRPRLAPAGDCGWLVTFGAGWDERVHRTVMAFARALEKASPPGMREVVPTMRSVLLRYEPAELPPGRMRARLEALLADPAWRKQADTGRQGRLFRLPAVYGGDDGPELEEAAALAGLPVADFVEWHAASELVVAMLGFAPGCAYLAGLDPAFDLPRKEALTPRVPAGALLVAVRQTVLPATPIPTGWRWIGRTPVNTLDLGRRMPFLLAPGDRVRFEPVGAAEAARVDPAGFWPPEDGDGA